MQNVEILYKGSLLAWNIAFFLFLGFCQFYCGWWWKSAVLTFRENSLTSSLLYSQNKGLNLLTRPLIACLLSCSHNKLTRPLFYLNYCNHVQYSLNFGQFYCGWLWENIAILQRFSIFLEFWAVLLWILLWRVVRDRKFACAAEGVTTSTWGFSTNLESFSMFTAFENKQSQLQTGRKVVYAINIPLFSSSIAEYMLLRILVYSGQFACWASEAILGVLLETLRLLLAKLGRVWL